MWPSAFFPRALPLAICLDDLSVPLDMNCVNYYCSVSAVRCWIGFALSPSMMWLFVYLQSV